MGAFHYKTDSDNIVTITMDMDGPVNLMNHDYVGLMEQVVDKLEAQQDTLAGVIITSAKSTFFAGGDLKGIYRRKPSQVGQFFTELEHKKTLLRRLEKLGKPVVAAINGTALGGGFEICLACSHRIAIDTPKTILGLPEATMNLLPGAGGVVRTLHMLGVTEALKYVLELNRITVTQALEAKLIDDVAADQEELMSKATAWIKANPEFIKPWDVKRYKIPAGEGNSLKNRRLMGGLIPATVKKGGDNQLAAQIALDIVADSLNVDFDTALRIETRGLATLVISPQAKGLVAHNFLHFLEAKTYLKELGVEKRLNQIGDIADVLDQVPELTKANYCQTLKDALQQEAVKLFDEGYSAIMINKIAEQLGLDVRVATDKSNANRHDIALDDMRDRLLFSQVLAAVKIFAERKMTNLVMANVASVVGCGFPANTGGVFEFIKQYGLSEHGDDCGQSCFSERSEQLANKFGAPFMTATSLAEVLC